MSDKNTQNNQLNLSLKSISFVSFLILIVLATTTYVFYNNIKSLESHYIEEKIDLEECQWQFIAAIIQENQIKAKIQADEITNNIQKELPVVYSNNLKLLEYDMDNMTVRANTPFLKTLARNIENKWTVKETDANDPFVICTWVKPDKLFFPNGAIGSDKSINCAKLGEIRTFDIEISMHSNKKLALSAINKILNKETEDIIVWEFLKSVNENHKLISTGTFKELKEIFLSEGLESLKTYEVLVPSYLTQNGDIFGVEDVDNTGNRNSNKKIIGVSTFNIYDAIMVNHESEMRHYMYEIETLEDTYSYRKQILQVEMVMLCVLIFVVFLCIGKIQNNVIESKNILNNKI